MENGADARPPGGDGSAQHGTDPKEKSQSDGGQGWHRRSVSGSILGSLPFLKSSAKSPKHEEQRHEHAEGAASGKRASSMATALMQSQGRKRKGSLRKAAMLGTGKLLRERRNSVRAAAPTIAVQTDMPHMPDMAPDAHDADEETTPRRFRYENESLNSSSDSGWAPQGTLSVSTTTNHFAQPEEEVTPRAPVYPITSPVGPYASTTDDDEGLSFFRSTTASSSSSYNAAPLQPSSSASPLPRRRSNRAAQQSSLTIVHTAADADLDDEWDYSETEWWGWVVLVVTWIVFVVGMGSCLGVWSWAWDVGETPYAPPELEDDPTLPITGYYPALMVCTAVMAWVWVVVAWVGMKYFRHAKEG